MQVFKRVGMQIKKYLFFILLLDTLIVSSQDPFLPGITFFEKAVQLRPTSTTAKYYYGYTLDKLNSSHSEKIDG